MWGFGKTKQEASTPPEKPKNNNDNEAISPDEMQELEEQFGIGPKPGDMIVDREQGIKSVFQIDDPSVPGNTIEYQRDNTFSNVDIVNPEPKKNKTKGWDDPAALPADDRRVLDQSDHKDAA